MSENNNTNEDSENGAKIEDPAGRSTPRMAVGHLAMLVKSESIFRLGSKDGSQRLAKPQSFIDLSLTDLAAKMNQLPTARMRAIDTIRKYNPTVEECDKLNMSNNRINLTKTNDVISMCGGCKGIRFKDTEMKAIMILTAQLAEACVILDKAFKSIPQDCRNKLPTANRLDAFRSDSAQLEDATIPYLITSFHDAAEAVIHFFLQIQDFVQIKQAQLDELPNTQGSEYN